MEKIKEDVIEEIRKQLAHERYLKNKKNIDRWRKLNREKYNTYNREYMRNRAVRIYQERYENT